ncbi:hypothetical protein EXN66_Car014731 [Channa argus]|uniref:Uncharacterized protein n=1 Tax=Channa argus TaxID=215402 RepID=A0A6G1Q9F6_CHAAH|nr:hypothetical protein EXN66_Car014731 [Channa argus]
MGKRDFTVDPEDCLQVIRCCSAKQTVSSVKAFNMIWTYTGRQCAKNEKCCIL